MLIDFLPHPPIVVGQTVRIRFSFEANDAPGVYELQVLHKVGDNVENVLDADDRTYTWEQREEEPPVVERTVVLKKSGTYTVGHKPQNGNAQRDYIFDVLPFHDEVSKVSLVAADAARSDQVELWDLITDVSDRLRFQGFLEHFKRDSDLAQPSFRNQADDQQLGGPRRPAYGMPTYRYLHRLSTEFVTQNVTGDKRSEKSYVSSQGGDEPAKPYPDEILRENYPLREVPFVELIFVYWMEEAMLFQSLNHIIARFQNRRIGRDPGPLARFAVSPLMPLRGLLWGLSEAERERLSVRRRDSEYGYQYGLQLVGRAVPPSQLAVERRTQFLPAFHSLLNAAHRYYKERDDLTMQADAFPLLNSLRELHLVLARGANNQFAELPLIARIETLDVQWMLAQPEMHQFLGGPTMVPYEEPWMDRVDTMKQLFGWSDASVTHFHDLAFHGERLVLSVRHGRWNESGMKGADAENWALRWRNSVQRYIHAYHSVTGVDLAQRVDITMPSTLISRRLVKQFV